MASIEENDEAEQLRFLALKSMVKRSKPNNSKCKKDETDDQDILLLRAAALKTINTHKTSSHNDLLANKNKTTINTKLINEKKRNSQSSPSRSKKNIKLKHNVDNERKRNLIDHDSNYNELSRDVLPTHYEKNVINDSRLKPNKNSYLVDNKDDAKKIVRNGSIQLSNLDSEKVNETMVLHITFSSSESDDSSSECDANNIILHENVVNNSIENNVRPSIETIDNNIKTDELNQLEDKRLTISYMQSLTDLMRRCESEIEKRNQQVTILLEAYKKYQNHSQSLCSILQAMKTIRDELSKCSTMKTKTADH